MIRLFYFLSHTYHVSFLFPELLTFITGSTPQSKKVVCRSTLIENHTPITTHYFNAHLTSSCKEDGLCLFSFLPLQLHSFNFLQSPEELANALAKASGCSYLHSCKLHTAFSFQFSDLKLSRTKPTLPSTLNCGVQILRDSRHILDSGDCRCFNFNDFFYWQSENTTDQKEVAAPHWYYVRNE